MNDTLADSPEPWDDGYAAYGRGWRGPCPLTEGVEQWNLGYAAAKRDECTCKACVNCVGSCGCEACRRAFFNTDLGIPYGSTDEQMDRGEG